MRAALKKSKGPSNFRNLFMSVPNGTKDGKERARVRVPSRCLALLPESHSLGLLDCPRSPFISPGYRGSPFEDLVAN